MSAAKMHTGLRGFYDRIYAVIKAINAQVEDMPCLKEESRKLYRFIKRVEVLVSDLQPYIGEDATAVSSLQAVEAALLFVRGSLDKICQQKPLAGYLGADRMLLSFKVATDGLDAAVGALPLGQLSIQDEVSAEVDRLRGLLQRAVFELQPQHLHALATFRAACDQLGAPFEAMREQTAHIIKAVAGTTMFSKEAFPGAINELRDECERVLKTDHAHDAFYLRMMMDMVRIHHVPAEPPVEYLCPLTLQVMDDPVVLVETGHSYNRAAITDWFRSGHAFCPRSGVKIRALNVTSNQNLKEAIRRWHLHNDLQLSFRPIAASMFHAVQDSRPTLSTASTAGNHTVVAVPTVHDSRPAPPTAASTTGNNAAVTAVAAAPAAPPAAAGLPAALTSAPSPPQPTATVLGSMTSGAFAPGGPRISSESLASVGRQSRAGDLSAPISIPAEASGVEDRRRSDSESSTPATISLEASSGLGGGGGGTGADTAPSSEDARVTSSSIADVQASDVGLVNHLVEEGSQPGPPPAQRASSAGAGDDGDGAAASLHLGGSPDHDGAASASSPSAAGGDLSRSVSVSQGDESSAQSYADAPPLWANRSAERSSDQLTACDDDVAALAEQQGASARHHSAAGGTGDGDLFDGLDTDAQHAGHYASKHD